MRDRDNILAVSQLQPDFMGFIFYAPLPRYVGDDFRMPGNLPAQTNRVGVFVNQSDALILQKIEESKLDFVQLHGEESAQQCHDIKKHGVGVIKVFSVDDDMNFQITEEYAQVADYFLFDTKGIHYGGNAKTFNWDVLSRYDQKVPFFLSGGITLEHITRIKQLKGLNLAAIDVNGGVEVRPAFKDVNKIKAIQAILNSKQ